MRNAGLFFKQTLADAIGRGACPRKNEAEATSESPAVKLTLEGELSHEYSPLGQARDARAVRIE